MADETERGELIEQFRSVTGADSDRAQFYLESSGWQLHFALSSFFDESTEERAEIEEENKRLNTASIQKKASTRGNPRIGTISGFTAEDSEESDDEEGQAYYAGGSEHSGQQIVGPPRKKKEKNNSDMTQSIFDAAKRHGAEVVDKTQEEGRKNKRSAAFRGSGYRLGDHEEESRIIKSASSGSMGPPQPVEVTLTFWSNGFSVDNGPLRGLEDPENQEFLDSVKRGEIPRELLRLNRGGEVHVNMVDNRHDEYVKPKEKMKAFTGAGHMLGSPTPRMVGGSHSESPATKTSPVPPETAHLDETAAVTSIQIRLADGTRLVSKFNHTHKISDVRKFVLASRPQTADRHFVLMTTFPNKELTDETLSLEEAKLLNAVIIQRFK